MAPLLQNKIPGTLHKLHCTMAAEMDAREACQDSTVDGHAMLEQRLTCVEGVLQGSVGKHGQAEVIHGKLIGDVPTAA